MSFEVSSFQGVLIKGVHVPLLLLQAWREASLRIKR